MKGYLQLTRKQHFPLIRTVAIFAAGGLLLAAGLIGVARWDANAARIQRETTLALLGQQQAELESFRQTLADLQRDLPRFQRLQASGFVGAADRLAWTEALMAEQQQLDLPNLLFELAPPEKLLTAEESANPYLEPFQTTIASGGAQAHDMRLMINGVDEEELLELLQRLQARNIGQFRVERCKLQRAAEGSAGLDVDCTLRWITFAPTVTESGSEESQ